MSSIVAQIRSTSSEERSDFIVRSFTDNYRALIDNSPHAWRGKFRKMAQSPFAFYRGSAALYYADVSRDTDPFLNEKTSRVWIQGDMHAQNFGTYMNGAGVLVFDVNDYDEAYVAPFTWDVKRLIASLGLIGHQKALSDADIRAILGSAARGYTSQVARFANSDDKSFALTLSTATGKIKEILQQARLLTRVGLLDRDTEIVDGDRRFRVGKFDTPASDTTRRKIEAALLEYYETIPQRKRRDAMAYTVKDVLQRGAVGIGSAGLTVFSLLLEGETQALENDLIISFKEAQVAAPSRNVDDQSLKGAFIHDGQRTAISQRALQAYSDPLMGYSTLDGKGMYVCEISPYVADLDWEDINDMDEILEVSEALGRCVAKIHCTSDDDSDHTIVPYSIEQAIHEVLDGRETEFVEYLTEFGEGYASIVRSDYNLFVDAFRNHHFGL